MRDNRLDDYCLDTYHQGMSQLARAKRFDSPQQEAYLSLWRTYDRLRAIEDELFASWELTAQQYNLLRLLRAAHPEPVPTLSLASRLVSRAPDVTRMIDKLEARQLITRTRSTADRRAVLVRVTDAGIDLLRQIDEPLRDCHERQLGHLAQDDLNSLIALLERARAPHEEEGSPWK
jgi:DNA-binding MarR family transcriptional regulator